MRKGRRGAVLRDCLRKNRVAILLWVLTVLTEWVVFYLYRIMWEPLLYAGALTLALGLLLLGLELRREMQAARERLRLREAILTEWNDLPEEKTLEQADYGDMIRKLGRQLRQETATQEAQRQDMLDYYTTWVHQIKTPMAVMKLYLGSESPEHRAMGTELFRMEQYVDMVLGYLRIGSIHADLSPQEVPLEALVRESVKKVSTLFIHQKSTTLQISSLPGTVLTDKKWFSFVLEQILTNAAKYTPRGTVRVYLAKDSPDTLVVEDTGLGIRAEDLPRIFERGFTGYNGRGGQRSTGLGLYLCHEVLQRLGHTISIRSEPGKGTAVCICFARGTLVVE